jgi:hypothetical protein
MLYARATIGVLALAMVVLALGSPCPAAQLRGDYLETRTCDIYTGPCFANSQMGLTGQEALMAWSIREGKHEGVDLSGLKVALAVRGSDTLGYGVGLDLRPEPIRLLVLVDEKANSQQRKALVDFARTFAGPAAGEVVRVDAVPIEMNVDHDELAATLKAGSTAELVTRKIAARDCRCTNELIYYPPLAKTKSFQPAATQEGRFRGRGLGSQWSNPDTTSSFVGTFEY